MSYMPKNTTKTSYPQVKHIIYIPPPNHTKSLKAVQPTGMNTHTSIAYAAAYVRGIRFSLQKAVQPTGMNKKKSS